MDYHHHARLTIHQSRGTCQKALLQGRLSLREAAAELRLSRQSAAKWVRRFRPRAGPGLCGSQLASSPLSTQHYDRAGRAGGATAARTLDRRADRPDHRPEPRHRQPHPDPAEAQQDPNAGTADPHRPLRTRRPWRPAAHRHQEAGPHRQARPSHHRPSPATKLAAPVGSSSTWPSTTTPASPLPP